MEEVKLDLVVIVTKRHGGEKIVEALNGLTHLHAIIRSRGTAKTEVLAALGIGEPEKDMLICFAEHKNIPIIYDLLDANFHFTDKHEGVAFTIPISAVGGNVTLQILLGKTKNLL